MAQDCHAGTTLCHCATVLITSYHQVTAPFTSHPQPSPQHRRTTQEQGVARDRQVAFPLAQRQDIAREEVSNRELLPRPFTVDLNFDGSLLR